MIPTRATPALFAFLLLAALSLHPIHAAEEREIHIISGEGAYFPGSDFAVFTNDVVVTYQQADEHVFMTADQVSLNEATGEAVADGNVRIQQGGQVWTGEHVVYNFKTRQMITDRFRTGTPPVFAAGRGLSGDLTNQVYYATNAFITSDDVAQPAIRVRAREMRVVPGERIQAKDAVLYLGDVPVFYFPYYSRRLGEPANGFNFTPGYRSRFGPFLLTTYRWTFNEQLDGAFNLDYRLDRGIGLGPDLNLHLGRWGDASIEYYYTHDDDPRTNGFALPVYHNRQRLLFSYQAHPFTNFSIRSLVRYQSDIGVIRDFFEGEYRRNPQPNTFVEANKLWRNFSLDVLAQPRVNDFFETVERLPDVRLTGFQQQLGNTPLYYQSESSVGYYRRRFAETNATASDLNFSAERADTYHELTVPRTFFGWLNVTPRAGGRFTYYGEADGPGGATDEAYRGVFNTGAEVSLKAWRLWPDVENRLLDLDGVRHIVEPSVNYVYVPRPNERPFELPQFDYESPSLRLLPIQYPEYNAIDSIDSQNVIRFGLRNRLQTKREDRVEDVLRWEVFTDWRLRPRSDQDTFADVYSDLSLRPRSWLRLESQTRFDLDGSRLRMALHTLTIEPNNVWSVSLGHFYLRDDFSSLPTALGQGNDLITTRLYYRMNEDWGFRATHHYDLRNSLLQEQYYTVYRDFRSWTAALTFGWRDNEGPNPDEFVATFAFSLKALPRFNLGSDTVRPHTLLGR